MIFSYAKCIVWFVSRTFKFVSLKDTMPRNLRSGTKPGLMAYACNISTWEAEVGGS
jgi:hypothetical protein